MALHFDGDKELDGGPLSPLSEAYLATHPGGMHTAVYLEGDLDVAALSDAIASALGEFPALKGVLRERRSGLAHRLIRVPQTSEPKLAVHEVPESLEKDGRYEQITRIVMDRKRPFDLFGEAPVRFHLFRFLNRRAALVINSHHTCADGTVIRRLILSILGHYHRRWTGHSFFADENTGKFSRIERDGDMKVGTNLYGTLRDLYRRKSRSLMKHPPNPEPKTGTIPSFACLELTAEETRAIATQAKAHSATVNDWVNVALIRAADRARDYPKDLMSVCLPVDLRRHSNSMSRHANLTSGFYVHLAAEDRRDPEALSRTFKKERSRLMSEGRAVFNLKTLQRLHAVLRCLPYRRRAAFLESRGYYPATFFCSNLGVIRLPADSFGNGVKVLSGDVWVFPNRSADYSVIALTYGDRLKMFVSADTRVVPPEEFQCFQTHLGEYLLQNNAADHLSP